MNDRAPEWQARRQNEMTHELIQAYAEEGKFVTPRDIRRELQLPCAARTVRRRLDEVNLFGRVAREADTYDDRILTFDCPSHAASCTSQS